MTMKTKSSSIGVMCYGHRVVFAQLVQTCFVQTKESFSGEPQTSLEWHGDQNAVWGYFTASGLLPVIDLTINTASYKESA